MPPGFPALRQARQRPAPVPARRKAVGQPRAGPRAHYCGGSMRIVCVLPSRSTTITTASLGLSLRNVSYYWRNAARSVTGWRFSSVIRSFTWSSAFCAALCGRTSATTTPLASAGSRRW